MCRKSVLEFVASSGLQYRHSNHVPTARDFQGPVTRLVSGG